MKEKVIFFAQQIHEPWIEGVKNNSIQICRELSSKTDISIISHSGPHNNKTKDIISGIPVFYLLHLHDNKLLQAYYLCLGAIRACMFTLKYKPKKIFVQYLDTSYLLCLVFIKILRPRTKIILTVYSPDELLIGYKRIFLRLFTFSKIIIISEYLRGFVKELSYLDTDIEHIPLSFDKKRYLKYENFSLRDKKTILFSAGAKKEAGSFLMVDLAEIMPEYTFIFAIRKFNKKSENELEKLQEYINSKGVKNIEIHRNIDKMEELLGRVGILILPLLDVRIKMLVPVALLEAMSRGTICFVSDLDHLKSLVTDNKNAYVFDKENIEDLKNKILKNSENELLAKEAYKFACEYPDFSEIANYYYKLI